MLTRSAVKGRNWPACTPSGAWARSLAGLNGPALSLIDLFKDADAEVRAQAAKTLGDYPVGYVPGKGSPADKAWPLASEKLIALLDDPSPRVRFFAAQTLGKIGRGPCRSVKPIVKLLSDNADKDLYLRHAGVMAMAGNFDHDALLKVAKHPSSSVRMAAVLAMRRQKDADVSMFLNDNDPKIVLEAARAIADTNLTRRLCRPGGCSGAAHVDHEGLAGRGDRSALSACGRQRLFASAESPAPRPWPVSPARTDVSNKMRIEAL